MVKPADDILHGNGFESSSDGVVESLFSLTWKPTVEDGGYVPSAMPVLGPAFKRVRRTPWKATASGGGSLLLQLKLLSWGNDDLFFGSGA